VSLGKKRSSSPPTHVSPGILRYLENKHKTFSDDYQLKQTTLPGIAFLCTSISGKMKKETSARSCLPFDNSCQHLSKIVDRKVARSFSKMMARACVCWTQNSNTTWMRFLLSSHQRRKFKETSANQGHKNCCLWKDSSAMTYWYHCIACF